MAEHTGGGASPSAEAALQTRVAALEARVAALEGRRGGPGVLGDPDLFKPRAECLVCGAVKPPGRVELTCKACGTERYRALRGLAPRPVYGQCFNCGAHHRPSMQLLCTACGRAYAAWKAAGGASTSTEQTESRAQTEPEKTEPEKTEPDR